MLHNSIINENQLHVCIAIEDITTESCFICEFTHIGSTYSFRTVYGF